MKIMRKGVWQTADGIGGWAVALISLSTLMIPAMWMLLNDQSYSNAAQHAKRVSDAAEKYVADNASVVSAGATPTTPYVIDVATLKSSGYLPSGFSVKNTYAQDYQVRVLEPTANKFQTIVVTLNGDVISQSAARKIASRIGADGGYIENGVAKGALGSWSQNISDFAINPGNGHIVVALFYKNNVSTNDYLYRKSVPGHPELNAMTTALSMGGNDVNSANNVNASTVNASGTVNAQDVNTRGETYTGNWFRTRGDTGWYSEKWGGGWNMTDGTWIRAYGGKNVWTPGVVQADSGLSTSGDLNSNRVLSNLVQSYGDSNANGSMTANGNMTANGGMYTNYMHSNGNIVAAGDINSNRVISNSIQSYGRLTVGEFVQIQGVATVGWGCPSNGLVGHDGTGALVSCTSGVWRKPSSGTPGYYCRYTSMSARKSEDYVGYVPRTDRNCPVISPGQVLGECACMKIILDY